MAALPEGIITEAARHAGLQYVWGGADLSSGADCSGFVEAVFATRGVPFPQRFTAEGLRQFCTPVPWDQVQPGDLLFVDHPEDRVEPAAADGYSATHVGISLGVGSGRVWSAQAPAVVERIITGNPWWQGTPDGSGGLVIAGRHPSMPATPLPTTPDRVFTVAEVFPVIQQYATLYGAGDAAPVMLAIGLQESPDYETFTKLVDRYVHDDGHGRGFFGTDDRYGLKDLEAWCGIQFASDGPPVGIVPPVLQIEYLAYWMSVNAPAYGSAIAAAQAWHTGPAGYGSADGQAYELAIRQHLQRLGVLS